MSSSYVNLVERKNASNTPSDIVVKDSASLQDSKNAEDKRLLSPFDKIDQDKSKTKSIF